MALRRTALAGFARLGDTPGVLQGAFGASASLLLRTVVPVAALLGALAPDLVTTLYGPGWQDAVAPLRCLVGLSVLRLLFGLATDVLTALGRTAALPLVQAWWWLVLVVAMPLAAHRFGLRGVASTEIAAALLLAAPCYATALRRAGIPLVGLGRRVTRDLAPSVALVAGAVLAQRVLPTPTARLAGGLVLGGAAYGLALGTTRARRRSGEATLATILRQSRK